MCFAETKRRKDADKEEGVGGFFAHCGNQTRKDVDIKKKKKKEVFVHCRNQTRKDADKEEGGGGLCALRKPNRKIYQEEGDGALRTLQNPKKKKKKNVDKRCRKRFLRLAETTTSRKERTNEDLQSCFRELQRPCSPQTS